MFNALRDEYALYEKYGYDCKNYRRDYDISGLFEDPIIKAILETPIEFDEVISDKSHNLI